MAKKLFKRIVPDIKKIQNNKFINLFGTLLHNPNLWHLNRYSIATTFSIALFCTFVPLPIHTPLAILLAIAFKANIPICIFLLWINTPITYVPIFYLAFKVGSFLLNIPATPFHFELSYHWVAHELYRIWQPFLLGCLVCAVFFAVLGNIIIRILWRCSVSYQWRKRHRVRAI